MRLNVKTAALKLAALGQVNPHIEANKPVLRTLTGAKRIKPEHVEAAKEGWSIRQAVLASINRHVNGEVIRHPRTGRLIVL